MFTIGQHYTRDEIHDRVGGSKQSYLPTLNGAVVAACLTQALNPRAPEVVLCGRGPRIAEAGDLLAAQSEPVPVFLKRAVNRWEYRGRYRCAASHTGGLDFDRLVAGSGREPSEVSRAVVLRPVQ